MITDTLAYFATPGGYTDVRGFEDQVDAIAPDARTIATVVQGLLIHKAMAPAYGVTLSPERAHEAQILAARDILAKACELRPSPISERRQPADRVVVVCRHFATLFVAIARHKGIPARVRAGFADYFDRTKHLEHWVAEYWHPDERRWLLVDAQAERAFYRTEFDTLDVPRDRFLVAGDAWRACRDGADAQTYGVGGSANWGIVEVFGEIFQDLAALQKIELLPWGWYGLALDEATMAREPALVDTLAEISSAATPEALSRLASMIELDARLRPPRPTGPRH
ncbi:MAG: transglutaminase domain-containing protein [Chloroflexi bacterium]|nr:transglutaminase domain-containing protein [Chloroflexota bacterium]